MSYNASQIDVLEGLEPVRKRPAMYIGGTHSAGYHHLLWEIVDNSVDEAINGHASRIEVVLDDDLKGATVIDNGRGIPVDKHPKHKKPALELILCTLHAGGKFEGGSYKVSGGLHGVGSSVVNALSETMLATVWREGKTHTQEYSRGIPTTKLKSGGKTSKRGTSIHFRPDARIFGKLAKFDAAKVRDRLEAKSYLHKGLKIVFRHRNDKAEFEHAGGIVELIERRIEERGKPRVHPQVFELEKTQDDTRVELVLQWTEAPDERIESYANGIPTISGGTHENGLKSALNKAVRGYIEAHKVRTKGLKITSDDIREGLVAIVSVYVPDPQFQGQTKSKLNNTEVAPAVEGAVRTALEQWLHDNKSSAESIIGRVLISARAREASRAAVKEVKRKSAVNRRSNLPGKLADCQTTDPEEAELFLVEGDSAGGIAKQGRDRRTQAILPLRGKVLNAERATTAAVLANKELQNIITALGCGVGKSFDISRLRYGRVFLLMDADSDGHHISTLLLTFFYRLLPSLVRAGHVYLAMPPLYRIDVGKETHWALDDAEKEQILSGLPKNAKPSIGRFKGLGEMNAKELWDTTLNPAERRAMRVVVASELETDTIMNELMGKDAAPRYEFIMEHAPTADAEELDL